MAGAQDIADRRRAAVRGDVRRRAIAGLRVLQGSCRAALPAEASGPHALRRMPRGARQQRLSPGEAAGGRQFETKNDPQWKILAEWVAGKAARAGRAY